MSEILKKRRKNNKEGVLLLELIVALGIFISVMVLGMGAVLMMFSLGAKGQSLKDIMTNLNFSLDSMSREITVAGKPREIGGLLNTNGSSLRCMDSEPINGLDNPLDCTGGEYYITFCGSEGDRIAYHFNDTDHSIERRIEPVGSDCPSSFTSNSSWQRFTGSEVKISNLKFYVIGTTDKSLQPRVVLKVEGSAKTDKPEESDFEIQTTLSQRSPDLSILYTTP